MRLNLEICSIKLKKMEANTQQTEWVKTTEFNRYGLITVILLLVGCMGGAAVGAGAINNTFALTLVTVPTMLTLSLLLAVASMKWIIRSAILAILIDLLMIVYFVLLV